MGNENENIRDFIVFEAVGEEWKVVCNLGKKSFSILMMNFSPKSTPSYLTNAHQSYAFIH